MMPDHRELHAVQGRLVVKACGYWFTHGGEKGSFGYYPHLKTPDGYPVYPDTQIRGDLRMAARWLANLDPNIDQRLIARLFGRSGRDYAGWIKVGDLVPDAAARSRPPGSFYQVKPRISIADETRTVVEGMLVDREMAYLDGVTLEADLFLSDLRQAADLRSAMDLITQAAGLLSGFGGGRSRGYGRGSVSVKWQDPVTICPTEDLPAAAENCLYLLEALVNVRNKPVEPGAAQTIASRWCLSSDQLRGWFVRAYQAAFGAWPTPEELQTIRFPELYPSDGEKGAAAFPPPMTTLANADGRIRDHWGQTSREDAATETVQISDTFFNTKIKPLPAGLCVTDAPEPGSIAAVASKRIRNAVDDGFQTIENGLFVQELLPRGTVFAGRVHLADPQSRFGRQAGYILRMLRPVINGALFQPTMRPWAAEEPAPLGGPHLVIAPIPTDGAQAAASGAGLPIHMRLSTQRRYSSILKRPRRNRVVIAPGSVLAQSVEDATLAWKGFGKEVCPPRARALSCIDVKDDRSAKVSLSPELLNAFKAGVPTRAQAGLLRDFLHPGMTARAVESALALRAEKYSEKQDAKRQKLFSALLMVLQNHGLDDFVGAVRAGLEEVALSGRWKDKKEADYGTD